MSKRLTTFSPLDLWIDGGFLTTSRTIYLGGDIEQESVDRAIRGILALESISSTDPITLVLSSLGGEFYPAVALYDALRATSCPTTIKVLGQCMSSAVVILQGADNRLLGENTRILIHDGTDAFEGPVRDFEMRAKQCVLDRKLMYKIFASRSEQNEKFWERHSRNDRFLTPQECISLGLADAIITKYIQENSKCADITI